MEELIDFLDEHPEIKPFVTAECLEHVAQNPHTASVVIKTMKCVSDKLREDLGQEFQRSFDSKEKQ